MPFSSDGTLRDIQSREGIVEVYDHRGRYLGCMGQETWAAVQELGDSAEIRNLPATIERQRQAMEEVIRIEGTIEHKRVGQLSEILRAALSEDDIGDRRHKAHLDMLGYETGSPSEGDSTEWTPYHEFRKATDPPPYGRGEDWPDEGDSTE